jgi:hypothetical protein
MHHTPVFAHSGFRFNATAVRPVLFAVAIAVALCVLAVPALSSDSSDGGAGARLAPPLVPTTAAVTRAAHDSCAAMLRNDIPVGGRVATAHHPRNVMPVAIIGMMTGVNHVTGPREQAAAFAPDDVAASLDGRNARAIAAYRQCRAAALITTLSN